MRSDFTVDKSGRLSDTSNVNYFFAANEILNFYNNDICINLANTLIMNKYRDEYKFRVMRHYADNATIKIISAWDYIFQILSVFYGTEHLQSYKTRDYVIAFVLGNPDIFKGRSEYADDEFQKNYHKLISDKKVLSSGDRKKFKKALKKIGLSTNARLEKIFELYKAEEVRVLKDTVRNEVIHVKSLSFMHSIGIQPGIPCLFAGRGIHFGGDGWIDSEELEILLLKNTEILKEAIQIFNEIIRTDDTPNSTGNSENEYHLYDGICRECEESVFVAFNFMEILKDSEMENKNFICGKCGKDMVLGEQRMANERVYFNQYIENVIYFADAYTKFCIQEDDN